MVTVLRQTSGDTAGQPMWEVVEDHRRHKCIWLKGDEIDSGEFVKNLNAMAWYVEARKKSGQ